MLISEAVSSGCDQNSVCTAQATSDNVLGPRRKVGRLRGQAIETLAHAIEYLCEQALDEGSFMFAEDPDLQAVRLLFAAQRSIYLECPLAVSSWDRVRTLLGQVLAIKAPEMPSIMAK